MLIKFLDHPFHEPTLILVVTSRIESLYMTVRRKFSGQLQKQLMFISKCGLIEISICRVTWLLRHAKAVRWGRSCRQSISLFPVRTIFPTKFWQLGLFLIFLSYCYALHNVCSRDLQFPWMSETPSCSPSPTSSDRQLDYISQCPSGEGSPCEGAQASGIWPGWMWAPLRSGL